MLRLDYSSGSDSDGEFQPLLERNNSSTSIEFLENYTPALPTIPTYHPCPCCQVNQSSFYCPDCITACVTAAPPGATLPQRLAALSLSRERGRGLRAGIRPRVPPDAGQQRLVLLQVRLRLLRLAVSRETERTRVGRNRLRQLSSRNARRGAQLLEAGKQSFSEYLQECEERCLASRARLSRLTEELTQRRRLALLEMQSGCFPILKLAAAVQETAVSPLTRQDYVWVDPGERYSILGSCLPSASLYVTKLCCQSPASETARVSTLAALSHAAQLTQNIAGILDTLLPSQICFHTFNIPDTNVDTAQLSSAAALLENSVVYLAASQGVPSDLLLRGHALENLLTLLNPRNPLLGQTRPFAPYTALFSTQLSTQLSSRGVSNASDSDSDWEDLDRSVSPSYSCEEDTARGDVTRSRFLSFFWRSAAENS